jgi:hypothetical protein
MSRRVYAAPDPPGAPVPAPPPAPQDEAAGWAHFAVVTLRVEALDWLLLDAAGHRRARFAWDEAGALAAGWIAP